MKHLLTGVAMAAALAISAPGWAQPANPSGGNPMGMPGPNPGGPGLTPYSSGQARPAPAPAVAPPPASSMSDTSSATPPRHRATRKSSHGKMAGHQRHGRGPQLTGNVAAQLNQEELARLQAGNFQMPAAPPAPGMPPPARPMGSPNPPGPKTSGASGAGPR